ncbi:hypothetical protein PIB30_087111 [Stylosanthes scabra]|uniref:Uncharacterized protein n=1 Tax=Stylosanthes scabra TaxID=79078 RepID=A0ABU6VWY6_9FABA|nr:hypothetical protein [Stylosanthes scabra]
MDKKPKKAQSSVDCAPVFSRWRARAPFLNMEVFVGGVPAQPRWCARATPFRNAQDKDIARLRGDGRTHLNEGYFGDFTFPGQGPSISQPLVPKDKDGLTLGLVPSVDARLSLVRRQERGASGGDSELRPSVTGVEEGNGELVSGVDSTSASFRSGVERATAARNGARVGHSDDDKLWSSVLEWETATTQARRQEGDEPTTRGWRQRQREV